MNLRTMLAAALLFLALVLASGCFYVVDPGERGVRVTLGNMADQFIPPGLRVQAPARSRRSGA